MTRRPSGDDGSAGVEAAVAVVALLLTGFFLIGALRVTNSGGDVNAAAWSAARAAAATYDSAAATSAAQTVAAGVLADRGVACQNLTVDVSGDLSSGSVVTVDVTCRVSLTDVGLVGFTGARIVHGRGVEQVDVVRGGS